MVYSSIIQLIYDVAGGGRFRLLCTQPERMSEYEQQQLSDIGIIIPSLRYSCIYSGLFAFLYTNSHA